MFRIIIINEMAERRRIKRLRLLRLRLRDTQNPFNIPENTFQRYYRLPKTLVHQLVIDLRPVIRESIRSTSIPEHIQILAFLSVVSNGGYQQNVGHDFLLGISQTVVSRCVDLVGKAIEDTQGASLIKFPQSEIQMNSIKSTFYEKFAFPGIIGAIDCTHIRIQKPNAAIEHAYYNGRKRAHTKNVQIICDYNLNIININARYGGTAHDSYVWSNSQAKSFMVNLHRNGNVNTWLIGDSGYEQRPWMMTPIRNTTNASQNAYNVAHRKARNCVERCIGVFKGRFRIFGKDRLLRYSPQKTGTIINACAVLHNLMVRSNVPYDEDDSEDDEAANDSEDDEAADDNSDSYLQRGITARERLVQEFF